MDDKIYSITLSDGTIISDLKLNGNNFISKKEITSEIFEGNLDTIIINDGEMETTYKNMSLVQITEINNEYWFILREVPISEIQNAKMRSDIDYLAMMTDIEI